MIIKDLKAVLSQYIGTNVSNLEINTKDDTISFMIKKGTNEKPVTVTFSNVLSYYFSDDYSNENIEMNRELFDTILFSESGLGKFASVDNMSVSTPNFAVNLPTSSIFIEASTIEIGNSKFNL